MDRPYVFLCTGMSLDGKLSTSDKIQSEIATNDDKELVYEGRIRCDAIIVGGNTLIFDDPKLTVKNEERQNRRLALGKSKEPIKVAIISDLGSISKTDGDFFTTGDRKILFTTKKTSEENLSFFNDISEVYVFGEERVDLKRAMETLYNLGVKEVMVEGGGELICSLLNEDLVDEINLKIGNLILGGRDSPTFCDGEGFSQLTSKKVNFIELVRKENYLVLKCKLQSI